MSVHGFYDLKHANPSVRVLSGSFAPAGTSQPTDVKGKGFTVTRTGTGAFLITLRQKYNHMVASIGSVQLNTAASMDVQFGAYNAGAGTLVLRTQAGATPTDISANANNRVHFTLMMQASNVPVT